MFALGKDAGPLWHIPNSAVRLQGGGATAAGPVILFLGELGLNIRLDSCTIVANENILHVDLTHVLTWHVHQQVCFGLFVLDGSLSQSDASFRANLDDPAFPQFCRRWSRRRATVLPSVPPPLYSPLATNPMPVLLQSKYDNPQSPSSIPATPVRSSVGRLTSATTSYSPTVTNGSQAQKLNVVTRVAIEGKTKKDPGGASVRMYLKVRSVLLYLHLWLISQISVPLDSPHVSPGATIPLFPGGSVSVLSRLFQA